MADFKITSFSVCGLYGDTDIRVPIHDNRIVIVGVNGLGKTTFLNLFYYFISRQWWKLLNYEFVSLTLTINDRDFCIRREELTEPLNRLEAESPEGGSTLLRLRPLVERASADQSFSNRLLSALSFSLARANTFLADNGFPDIFLSLREVSYLRSLLRSGRNLSIGENLSAIGKYLDTVLNATILYLPTYRRIEKDLNSILPGFDEELRRSRGRRTERQAAATSYIEMIEFGMDDVESSIERTLNQQNETARAELNSLAGSYLGDVLRGEGETFDVPLLSGLSDDEVEDTFKRVEQQSLGDLEKVRLREVIKTIRDRGDLTTAERYVAHFFVKLLLANKKLRENSVPVARFVAVCNEYLEGKTFTYDDINYALSIRKNRSEIDLADLSSGEKQIVSLFSKVYIGTAQSYIIVIDEPELSLSVPWQERLLHDLDASGRCSFIGAVTHSPFIFANEFDAYAVDLGKQSSVSHNVVSE